MSETEIQLQITFGSIFEKLKIFKQLLSSDQLAEYDKLITEAKEKHKKHFSELSKESLELLENKFS
jgi:hypothetical protein